MPSPAPIAIVPAAFHGGEGVKEGSVDFHAVVLRGGCGARGIPRRLAPSRAPKGRGAGRDGGGMVGRRKRGEERPGEAEREPDGGGEGEVHRAGERGEGAGLHACASFSVAASCKARSFVHASSSAWNGLSWASSRSAASASCAAR